jgi:hypothetical protein
MNKCQTYKDAEEYYNRCIENNDLESKSFEFVDYVIKIYNSSKIATFEFRQNNKIIENRKYTKEQAKPYKELDEIMKYLDLAELQCWGAIEKCDDDGYKRSFELVRNELQKIISFCKEIRKLL